MPSIGSSKFSELEATVSHCLIACTVQLLACTTAQSSPETKTGSLSVPSTFRRDPVRYAVLPAAAPRMERERRRTRLRPDLNAQVFLGVFRGLQEFIGLFGFGSGRNGLVGG